MVRNKHPDLTSLNAFVTVSDREQLTFSSLTLYANSCLTVFLQVSRIWIRLKVYFGYIFCKSKQSMNMYAWLLENIVCIIFFRRFICWLEISKMNLYCEQLQIHIVFYWNIIIDEIYVSKIKTKKMKLKK